MGGGDGELEDAPGGVFERDGAEIGADAGEGAVGVAEGLEGDADGDAVEAAGELDGGGGKALVLVVDLMVQGAEADVELGHAGEGAVVTVAEEEGGNADGVAEGPGEGDGEGEVAVLDADGTVDDADEGDALLVEEILGEFRGADGAFEGEERRSGARGEGDDGEVGEKLIGPDKGEEIAAASGELGAMVREGGVLGGDLAG
jgi:hypothetical protein